MTMRRWVDWVNVGLGVWLIVSPWLLTAAAGYTPADWSSWSVGAAIVTVAFFAMYKSAVWGDAVGVMLGAWLIASPWLLGFASASASAANAVIIGMLVICYALWAMRIDMIARDVIARDVAAYRVYQRRPA